MLAVVFLHTMAHAQVTAQFTVCSPTGNLAGSDACDCIHAAPSEWHGGNSAKGWPAVTHVSVTGPSKEETITDTCFEMDRYITDSAIPNVNERTYVRQLGVLRAHHAAAQADVDHGGLHAFDSVFDNDGICTSTELMSMDGGEAFRVRQPTFVVHEKREEGVVVYRVSDEDGVEIMDFLTNGAEPVEVDLWDYDDDDELDIIVTFEEEVQWWIPGPFEDAPAEPPEEE